MNKKKILLLATVSSMVALVSTVIFANGGLSGLSALATNGEVWHHYAAVAPTEARHGSKEFWASSTDGCATHTFTDPKATCIEHNFYTYDSFATLTCDDDRYVPSRNESLGITPMFSTKNNTVTYGLYPQKNVNDSTLISALNKLTTSGINGWYLYENEYYAKLSATPNKPFYTFDNGTKIVSGTTYWFKCEPITWNVLSNTSGEYYILSSLLLDAHRYNEYYTGTKDGHYANNYEYSEIRAWLNNDFYNSAFALGNSYIQTTIVDNSAATTDSTSNSYACNNTQDKVFLPSYQDYINSSYGFSDSEDLTDTRCCKTTDWARARGAWYNSTDSSQLYNDFYWTRSPSSDSSNVACYVDSDGSICYVDVGANHVGDTYGSVRAALTIRIA